MGGYYDNLLNSGVYFIILHVCQQLIFQIRKPHTYPHAQSHIHANMYIHTVYTHRDGMIHDRCVSTHTHSGITKCALQTMCLIAYR